jgi:UDP-N-acetylmuramoyl-L-alanyl-D-glutamate--2,6-diaminopimelate ligase
MKLSELMARSKADSYSCAGNKDVEVLGITYDSRKVRPGYIFVCIRGEHHDGHMYISEAAEKGAVAVVIDRETEVPGNLDVIRVRDSREALGDIAAAFYKEPSASLFCVGVTGTKGKTTTTYLIKSVLP